MIDLPADNKDILEYLAIRHPYWSSRSEEWELHDLVRERIEPEKFLVKGITESNAEYIQRKKLAVFTPETPMVVQRIIGFLKRNDSDRDLSGNSDLENFIEKADKKDRSFGDVMLDAILRSLWMESCFILVDRRTAQRDKDGNPIRPNSRADAEAQLGMPYLNLLSPRQVVNWWVGNNGKPEWITLREEYYHQEHPFDLREKRIQYRIFDNNSFATITIKPRRRGNEKKDQILVADEFRPEEVILEIIQGDHNLGKIPIIPLIPFQVDQENTMMGTAFTKSAVRYDLAAWRHESDYRYNLWLHNHPILCVRGDADAAIQFTSSTAVHLRVDENYKEDAFYISPPAEVFNHSREAIKEDRLGVWIQTYQDAASRIMENQKGEESGYHKRLSFEMAEGAILSHLTNEIVQTEKKVLEIVARYLDSRSVISENEKVFKGEITRKKSYDVFWVGDYIKIAKEGANFLQSSPKTLAEITLKIAQALLDSPSAQQIKLIEAEIYGNKNLLTNKMERLVSRVEALRAIDTPSEELIRKLHIDIAKELLGVIENEEDNEDNQQLLAEILQEIETADISMSDNNEFDRRLEEETEEELKQPGFAMSA